VINGNLAGKSICGPRGSGGETTSGDNIDISFSDIIENLDMSFMGTLTASKGKWTLITDAVYTNFTLDTKGTRKHHWLSDQDKDRSGKERF
jgi:hypothetical protein